MSSTSAEEKEKLVSSSPSSANTTAGAAAVGDDDDSRPQQQQQQFPNTPVPVLKIILLGSVATGKSSIISQFMYSAYDRHYRATLGIDFLTKLVSVHGQTVKLALWDTAGQERFRSLIPSYIRNSAGAIVVYDVSNRESFLDTTRWVEDVRQERGPDSGIVFFLVANKIDLERERVVTSEEGEARAREMGATYVEVSAKTGVNIKALFRKVSTTIPLPETPAAGGGIGGVGGIGGIGIPPVRRLDPVMVPASTGAGRPVNLGQPTGGGTDDSASSGGICGC